MCPKNRAAILKLCKYGSANISHRGTHIQLSPAPWSYHKKINSLRGLDKVDANPCLAPAKCYEGTIIMYFPSKIRGKTVPRVIIRLLVPCHQWFSSCVPVIETLNMEMAGEKHFERFYNVLNVFKIRLIEWMVMQRNRTINKLMYIMHSAGLRTVPRSAQFQILNVLFKLASFLIAF